ncbi:uncharacterized protein LOC133825274 [Humulus lupulus]|uniref:uncharacterized protein LOC133825274 n=1 Tax=Humulus lupulus TaxID=3486 RepID=UPI002B408B73|nr:uncharacterized protein LOC133825274 [Humulus lupulus]
MAENLRWHFTHKSIDGKMRHPVDTPAWDSNNERWPEFNLEPRNLRLGLAANGINPYKSLSSTYSCWPVMLVIYNLPPWLCMRDENTFLSLLIPGRKQPGNDIDIYLEPLIEDLNKLWNNGVHTYDAFNKSFFNLKAMFLWTINDFPAYGNLAGCTTKGKTACLICGNDTCATRLKHSKKISYQNTRRFLPFDHPYRSKKAWFNGATEERGPPKVLSGSEIVEELNQIANDFGKNMNPKKRSRDNKVEGMWKKKSIFFNLPYWKVLLVRHNLDVMHLEKNVCDSIISTLLDLNGKSKDHLNARLDLKDLGIKKALHSVEKDGIIRLPAASYTLSRSEKKMFCQRLFDLKLTDGYSSNISNCVVVEERKLMGLKSHDFHVLMQQLLVVAIRGLMEDGPREATIRLSKFFNRICQHVVDVKEIIELEAEVVETICMFERYFPPSFFDPMVHLVVHLGREVLLCGPIQFRWMYHFERYMKLLKGYVMQPTHPEASIAERYIADESMRFCASFLKQSNDEGSFIGRNEYNDSDVILEGRPLHRGVTVTLNDKDLASAHRYVLFNLAVTEQYLELAHGPRKAIISYKGYVINGQRFHTKDAGRTTQNSGVYMEATTMCRSSAKDDAQLADVVGYYGLINQIILLDYYSFHIPLFRCNWTHVGKGVKKVDWYTLVNLHQGQKEFVREPFILASQAKQTFYARENENSNCYIVLKAPPRGHYESEIYDDQHDENPIAQS